MFRFIRLSGPVTAALLIAISARGAQAQRIGARAQQAAQDPTSELRRLRAQLDSLERRIALLERGQVDEVKDESADDDRTSKLEKRLAALEQRNAALERAVASRNAEKGETKGSQLVRAPFIVHGPGGQTLFKVDIAEDGLARAVVGDPAGASVQLDPDPDGTAFVRVYSSIKGSLVALVAKPQSSYLTVAQGRRNANLAISQTEGALLSMVNDAGYPAVTLKYAQRGVGYLALTDAEGNIRVEAGTNADLIGQVRTSGPGGGGIATAPGMPSSFIRGWKK